MLVRMPPNKSHFEAFCFLRTNSLQRRQYAEQQGQEEEEEEETEDAAARLLSCEAGECDEVVTPAWAGRLEGLNYQLGRLDEKVEQLVELHTAQLARPGLEQSSQEERRISVQTREITEQVSQCGQQLRGLQSQVAGLAGRQQNLLQNIVTSLARRLQDTTEKFRRSQGDFLHRAAAREERTRRYLTTIPPDTDRDQEDDGVALAWSGSDQLQFQENTVKLQKRDQEFQLIVESIQDLNAIFQELATMVNQQSEVVDRIEYAVENTGVQVEAGVRQLEQTSKYQNKNRKYKCILVLCLVLFLLIIIIIYES